MSSVSPVRVRFVSDGERDVIAAFESIEARCKRLSSVALASAQKRAQAATRAARAEERGGRQYTPRGAPTAATTAYREEVRAAERTARETARLEKWKEKVRENSALAAGRIAKRQSDQEIRESQRAAKAEAAAVAKADNARQRSQSRALSGVGKAMSNASRSTLGTMGGIAGGIGMAAGTYAVGSAIMSSISLEESAALLSNSTAMPGMAPQDPSALAGQARRVAGQTGFKSEDVMGAMQTVAARAGGARGLMAFQQDITDVAKTARAAGVSMEDLGGVYASALNAGVAPGKEMQQLMMDLVAQGKAGAIEFSDLASELAKLGGAGRKFGSGADMLRQVSGWAQIAVESKVSPEESRTAVVDMLREMTMAEKIKGMGQLGARVAGENGKLNDPALIMADVIAGIESGKQFGHGSTKYGGKTADQKLGAYGYLFTGTSSDIAMNLRETYLKAGGGEAGKSAILSRVASAAGSTGEMSAGQRDAEYGRVMDTSAAKLSVGMEQFKTQIAALLPEITRMLPQLLAVTQGFAKLAVWLGKNPLEGLGLLFAASLTKELAAAAIPSLLKQAITGLQGATYTGTGVAPMGGSNALGAASAALAITATAVTITAMGVEIIDKASAGGEKRGKSLLQSEIEAGNIMRQTRAGVPLTADKQRSLAAKQQELERYSQSSKFGALGIAIKGGSLWDAINPLAGINFARRFFTAQAEQSQGVTSEGAAASAAEIAKFLAAAAESSKAIAANTGASSTSPSAPARNSPISAR